MKLRTGGVGFRNGLVNRVADRSWGDDIVTMRRTVDCD